MNTDYDTLIAQAEALTDGIPHFIANLANVSALIFEMMDDINWAGFYLRKDDKLVLGPFQGKTACIEIPFGKGVCGTAFAEDRTVLVEDVHCFEGHIACDSASNSEIVIPIHRIAKGAGEGAEADEGREVAGVLDIDSTSLRRFGQEDAEGLERLVKILEEKVF